MIGAALLAQLAVVATAPDTVFACQPVPVVVRVYGAGGSIPDLSAPDFGPFGIIRLSSGPRPDPTRAGGAMTDEYRYVLGSPRAGTFTIEPFEVRSGERTARSSPLRITVLPSARDTTLPRVVREARVARGDTVTFRALAYPDTVYVGEQATYEVAVFFEDAIRSRLRRNPEFFPPDMRAMLAYELPGGGRAAPRRESAGQCYEVPVFSRALFPLAAGRHVIPPARLVYSLTRPYSVWGGEESHQQRTDSAVLVAIDPPLANRPADFSGVVGAVRLSTRYDARSARVGDPLVLTVRVAGPGNIKLFARPRLVVPWGSIVPADERVVVDTTARLVRGAKEFDWLVTPRDSGLVVLPPLRYSYFDPELGEYAFAETAAESLHVAPGALAALPLDTTGKVAASPPLALRRSLRPERGAPPHDGETFWLVALVAPLPAVAAAVVRLPRRRRPTAGAARALRAIARGRGARDAGALRRAFVAALGERIGIAPAAIADRDGFGRALRRAGVSAETTERASALLASLDDVAYGHRGALARESAERAWSLYRRVDEEARPRAAASAAPLPLSLLLAALLATAAAASAAAAAAQSEGARAAFSRGLALYDARRFREAEHVFAGVAASLPRAPDAWANYGTAAWAAGDTAGAAVGWQRALRLEPVALDLRERLRRIPGQQSIRAMVLPVSPGALDALALVLWVAAWSAVAWRVGRRRPAIRGWPVVVGLAGAASVAGSSLLEERLETADLAITAAAAPMRALPALSAERTRALPVAEVLRVRERRDGWVRVETDDGRDGWIESSRLLPLVGPATPSGLR